MGKSLRIRLGKKDQLIKNWWDLLIREDGDISATITNCIAYYIKTGYFIEIAKVPILEKEFEAKDKKVYMSENSPTYKWLMEKQAQGEQYSKVIKRILRSSIKESKDDSYFIKNLDEIILAVEQAEKEHRIENQNIPELNYFPADESRHSHMNQEELTEKGGQTKLTMPYDVEEDSDEEVFDLYSLVGHSLNL